MRTPFKFIEKDAMSVFSGTKLERDKNRIKSGNAQKIVTFYLWFEFAKIIVKGSQKSLKRNSNHNTCPYAVPKMHPFKNQISLAILCLQESGRFGKLRQKWFETESLCPDDESVPDCGRDGLKNENMVGVFLVPTLGFVLSSIAALLEHV